MTPPAGTYDCVIVGAGPAGSSAAIRLARRGLRVLLVEQKKFPRGKLCGEFISPECLTHFAELDVLNEMQAGGGISLERTVFYTRNGRSISVPSSWFVANKHALGLSRAEMDLHLLNRARSVGVEVLEETSAKALLFAENRVNGVSVKNREGDERSAAASLVIDATGRGRALARQFEKNASAVKRKADFVAFKTHVKNADIATGDCEIYGYEGGYGGCSSVEDGLYNLCFIVSSDVAKKYNSSAADVMF